MGRACSTYGKDKKPSISREYKKTKAFTSILSASRDILYTAIKFYTISQQVSQHMKEKTYMHWRDEKCI